MAERREVGAGRGMALLREGRTGGKPEGLAGPAQRGGRDQTVASPTGTIPASADTSPEEKDPG